MIKISRFVYLATAWLFIAGVVGQVFLVGMTVVARQMGWDNHIGLGHFLAAPLLLMLISMYTGRLPGRIKRLNWLLFGMYVLQADVIIFLRGAAPIVSAFHPVLALADFAIGLALARAAWSLSREVQPQPSTMVGLETSTNS